MATDSSIASIMTHTITVVPPNRNQDGVLTNEYGEVQQGDADDELVSCFIDLKKRRVLDPNHRVVVFGATITFGAETLIGEDWQVKDGKNNLGELIIKAGRVAELDIIHHPDEGIIAKIARIELQ